MSKKTQLHDPFISRESAKYENPIPSRELIAQVIQSRDIAWSFEHLCEHLGLDNTDQQIALQRRLKAMLRENQLERNERGHYALPDRQHLIAGRVMANKEGYGFVIPDDGSDDLYLHWAEMRKVFDGDRVLAR